MPAPYSDDLYSADLYDDLDDTQDHGPTHDTHAQSGVQRQDGDEDEMTQHLSPTDGYFRASSSTDPAADDYYVVDAPGHSTGFMPPPPSRPEGSSSSAFNQSRQPIPAADVFEGQPASANVPRVPNVLVDDPRIGYEGTAESKAREAQEERLRNEALNNAQTDSLASPSRHAASPVVNSPVVPTASSSTWTASQPSGSSTPAVRTPPSTVAQPYSPVRSLPSRDPFASRAAPFQIPAEAPPAYTPSPTSPPNSPSQGLNNHPFRSYQTFGDPSVVTASTAATAMGVPDESRGLLSREPESMGGLPSDEEQYIIPRWQRRVGRSVTRGVIIKLLWVSLLISIIGALIGVAFNVTIDIPDKDSRGKDKDKDKDKDDGNSKRPQDGDPGKTPIEDMPWQPYKSCKSEAYRLPHETFHVDYSSSSPLYVVETIKRNDHEGGPREWTPYVWGQFIVRRLEGSAPGPSVDVEIITNDEGISVDVSWDDEEQSLTIETPYRLPWTQQGSPCIQIRATVWVPDDAKLQSLSLQATHLNVAIADNVRLSVERNVDIGTVSGNVRGPTDLGAPGEAEAPDTYKLDCRNIHIGTTSGDIVGWFPLYDVLALATVSGDIRVGIGPQPALESNPLPATLSVTCASGDIELSEPIKTAIESSKPDRIIPPRPYLVKLEAQSSDLKAFLAFGPQLDIAVTSGDVGLELLPVLDVESMDVSGSSNIRTETKSGEQAVTVFEPLWVAIPKQKTSPPKAPSPPSPPSPPTPPSPPVWPTKIPSIPVYDGDPSKYIPYIPYIPYLPDARVHLKKTHDSSDTASSSSTSSLARATGEQPAISCMKARHSTISGEIILRYPASWEGSIVAETVSGEIGMHGKGLDVDKRKNAFGKTYRGRKGKIGSTIAATTITGDMDILIGEAS